VLGLVDMTSPVLFHIGYHKTATTWMQRMFFIPKYGFQQIATHEDVDKHIVAPHGFDFDPRPMAQMIDEKRSRLSNAHVPVVSSEILSGQPFFGGLSSDVYANRIKEISPDARVLVSIRSQNRILVSCYMQYLLRGGTMSPKQFFEGKRVVEFYAFRPDHFEYDRLVAYYFNLFGPENVHVTTQESLSRNPDAAAADIAVFSENSQFTRLDDRDTRAEGKSYPEYAAPLLRRINHIQTSALNPNPIVSVGHTPRGLYRGVGYVMKRPLMAKAMANYKPVTEYVEKAFRGHYTESNRRLRDLLPRLDLSAYA
jgi:hypothetical protein